MPNLKDLDLSKATLISSPQAAPDTGGNVFDLDPSKIQTIQQLKEDKYGSLGQQVLGSVESVAHGVLGPGQTAIESVLSKAGIPGLTPEDQAARAEINPKGHYASEAAGFIAPLILSGGTSAEARAGLEAGELGASTVASLAKNATIPGLITQAGEGAAKLSGLGGEGASALSKIAASGIRTGAEVGALQAGEEVSKAINQDPSQTLGSAAINVGLATILGGVGGVALGGTSSLFRASLDKADKFINDAKAQVSFRQAAKEAESMAIPEASVAAPSVTKEVYDPFTKTTRMAASPEPALSIPAPEPIVPLTGKKSLGTKAGDYIFDKGSEVLNKVNGGAIGRIVGSIGGTLIGHPLFGAYIGEKTLGPIIDSLAKPLLENATDSAALKGSIDYLANAIKGQNTLNTSVNNFFKSGDIVPKHLIPDQTSRDKVQKSLDHIENPDNIMQVGGGIGHYLPTHGTAVAATAAQAKNYFASIKPKSIQLSPFDTPSTVSKSDQAKYNRALDIAQQPLLALKHAKDGTLLPQDVQTLQAVYPGLHKSMIEKLSTELISHKAAGNVIPYQERISLGMLMGAKFDSTMTPQYMQAVIQAAGAQQQAQQAPQGQQKKASGTELRQVDKTNALYATKSQAQDIHRRS